MANKRLGQHFLQNGAKLRKIADALGIRNGDRVVEIGPGRGELTRFLIEAGGDVTAIEKDAALIPNLRESFPSLYIVEGDVRELLPAVSESFSGKPYLLAGNIPYYLTGYLFRQLGTLVRKPERAVFTIQKEVAERIAKTDAAGMNILAASILWWADATYVTTIPRSLFSPPPKVDSAAILLTAKKTGSPAEFESFERFIRALFSHPRKLAASNLSVSYPKERVCSAFEALGIAVNSRAERFSFDVIEKLFRMLLCE